MRSLTIRKLIAQKGFLERLRAMDSRAWNLVTREYRNGILYACVRRVRSQADAEDICSQVFIRAIRQIGSFRGDASLKAWLHTIAYNLCMTHLSSARRFRMATFERVAAANSTRESPAAEEPSADRLIESAELKSAFGRAMAALDPDLGTAFHLREIEELSYDEIARVTGAPINTVKTRIFRARMQLRQLLAEHRP